MDTYVFGCVGCLEVVVVYGAGGLDDVTCVSDVHGETTVTGRPGTLGGHLSIAG